MGIEEIPNPHVEGPRIMIATVLIGISTGFIFLVRYLLSMMSVFAVDL